MSNNPTLPSFSAVYAFGDSLSDAGNLYLLSAATGSPTPTSPYYQESYTVATVGGITVPVPARVFSNGPTWVQDLSQTLGLGTLEPSMLGGTDYAFGGAETGSTPQNGGLSDPQLQLISVPTQIVNFETAVPTPSADALYTLSIGSNDLLDILFQPTLSSAQQTTDVQDAVNNEIHDLQSLIGAGATNLMVMNVPDLGLTPEVQDGFANGSDTPSAGLDSLAASLSAEYNSDLDAGLSSVASGNSSVNIYVVNAYQLIQDAVADPSTYGLTNATTPVWSGDYNDSTSGTLISTDPTVQDQYLFWDHLHPTETGEQALASLGEQALQAGPSIPCFAAGTRLRAEIGDVAVEQVRPGMRLHTPRGPAAVRWVGHRTIDCRRHPRRHDVWPVRVRRGAFGGQPKRDVVLSPDHAVFLRGVLIPVRYLVNGATVVQEACARVTYWHVELDRHDVVEAEGLPCESYLDTGNRGAFAGSGQPLMLHPDFARQVWAKQGCAPLVVQGPKVVAARRRLLAQAGRLGFRLTRSADLHVLADGVPVRPTRVDGAVRRFELRRRVDELVIASRSGVPAEVTPDGTDARRLGIMIERVAVFRPFAWQELPLDGLPDDAGFHRLEVEGPRRWRWTDGHARLPVPPDCRRDGMVCLDLAVGAEHPSWLPPDMSVAPVNRDARSA